MDARPSTLASGMDQRSLIILFHSLSLSYPKSRDAFASKIIHNNNDLLHFILCLVDIDHEIHLPLILRISDLPECIVKFLIPERNICGRKPNLL